MTGIERSDAVAVKGFEGGGRRGEGSDQLSLDHGVGIGIYL